MVFIQNSITDFINFYTVPPDFLYDLLIVPIYGVFPKSRLENLRQIGVEKYIKLRGTSVIYNLVNFYVGIIVLLTVLLLVLALVPLFESNIFRCCRRPLNHLKDKLVWNTLIRFCIETYYPVCIGVFVGLKSIEGNTDSQKVNTVLAAVLFFFCAAIPYAMYRFLRLYRPVLGNKEIKSYYHALYLQVDHFRISTLSFTLIQLYRKFAFITIVVFLEE